MTGAVVPDSGEIVLGGETILQLAAPGEVVRPPSPSSN